MRAQDVAGVGGAWLRPVAVGVGAAAFALLARAPLEPTLQGSVPFLFLFLGVVLATLAAGWPAGALTVVIGVAGTAYFTFTPRFSFAVDRPQDQISLLLFLVACTVVVSGVEAHRRAVRRARDSQAKAERSEAQLRSIFDNAAVGIARVGLDGRLLEVNDCFCQILGRERTDLVGRTFQDITHPDDLEPDVAQMHRLMAGEIHAYGLDKRYMRPSGESVWVHLTASLARDASGAADYFVAVVEDISEQKCAEEARDLLTREIDHRARNAMAVAQSIVRLTDASDPRRFKDDVSRRIDALARAQATLAEGAWSGAQLADVIAGECAACGVGPEQWRLAGSPILLQPSLVQSVGMIVHELATNAIKYGALSAPGGTVEIACAEGPGGGWRMDWVERGGPVVTAPTHAGFGSRLLGRLAQSLRASLHYEWRETGLVARLIYPGDETDARPGDGSRL